MMCPACRREIREKTLRAMQRLKQGSLRRGTIPYGYQLKGRTLVADAREQHGLAIIKEMRAEGHGKRLIAGVLNDLNIPTKKGGHWAPQTVGNILKRCE